MVLLLPLMSLVVLPAVLVVAWAIVLRWRGVPGWAFFAVGAGVVLLSLVAGAVVGEAEDRSTPYECRTGAQRGLECGLGIGRATGVFGAVAGSGSLAVLAVASLTLWQVRRHRGRIRPGG